MRQREREFILKEWVSTMLIFLPKNNLTRLCQHKWRRVYLWTLKCGKNYWNRMLTHLDNDDALKIISIMFPDNSTRYEYTWTIPDLHKQILNHSSISAHVFIRDQVRTATYYLQENSWLAQFVYYIWNLNSSSCINCWNATYITPS